MPCSAQPRSEFSLFTPHLHGMNFYYLTIKNGLSTQFITISETANKVQSQYFCIKFISYVQNVHHRPRRMRSDVDRRHAASHPRSAAVRLLAPEWFWALSELCEMPEALHPTHDSQVPGRWVEVW